MVMVMMKKLISLNNLLGIFPVRVVTVVPASEALG